MEHIRSIFYFFDFSFCIYLFIYIHFHIRRYQIWYVGIIGFILFLWRRL